MNRPPMLMHVKIQNDKTNFGIWLPLFLLIPLALVILIILSPLILIALIITWPSGWGRWMLMALQAAFTSFWAIRGLEVNVQNAKDNVYVSVI